MFRRPPTGRVFLCGGLIFLLGCAGTAPRQPAASIGTAAREEFDPQTLNDDDFLLQPPVQTALPAVPDGTRRPEIPDANIKRAEGYRIQIAAVLDRTRAEELRTQAGARLHEPVYVQYDPQTLLYKIHVGNCKTPGHARRLRQEAKDNGYPEAFVIRAQIEEKAAPPRKPTTRGYRVQIFSASSREAAEQALKNARGHLGREDIYVEFEPPFFKVRIGNFQSREEAEKTVQKARQEGYDTPFLVETEILIPPD